MRRAKSFKGTFWTGDDNPHQPGVLTVAPRTSPVVSTEQPVRSHWKVVRQTANPDGGTVTACDFDEEAFLAPRTVHGLDERGTKLSLLGGFPAPGPLDGPQRLRGLQAIVGGHIQDRHHRFGGFRVRLAGLDAWHLRLAHGDSVALADGSRIFVEVTTSSTRRRALWLVGQDLPAWSLQEIDRRFLRPLVTLFTLVTDSACGVLAYQVQEAPGGPWWDIYSVSLQPDSANDELCAKQAHWLLPPALLDLRHIGSWLDKVETLSPLPPTVTDLAHTGTLAVETQVLQLTTVAEGLHRRLYTEERRFDDETAQAIRETAAAAVKPLHESAESAVNGLLQHVEEPGYGQRLMQLARAAEKAMPGVTGKTAGWKKLVYAARNEFAHRISGQFLSDNDIDQYLTVVLSLRWLLSGLLLLETGITPDVLAHRFVSHDPYRRFLADAARWQPKIYSSSS